jgi:hypothetical protein
MTTAYALWWYCVPIFAVGSGGPITSPSVAANPSGVFSFSYLVIISNTPNKVDPSLLYIVTLMSKLTIFCNWPVLSEERRGQLEMIIICRVPQQSATEIKAEHTSLVGNTIPLVSYFPGPLSEADFLPILALASGCTLKNGLFLLPNGRSLLIAGAIRETNSSHSSFLIPGRVGIVLAIRFE